MSKAKNTPDRVEEDSYDRGIIPAETAARKVMVVTQ